MIIVPTNFSDSFVMADLANNVEDLEDGEIESEGEDTTQNENGNKDEDTSAPAPADKVTSDKKETQDYYYSKSGKKKKSKSNKGEQKTKDKSKKSRKYSSPTEDDFAGNIEKAIRKAMNKNENEDGSKEDVLEERRKHKKRKRQESKEDPEKKRKKQEYSDEMDESEMMCVRGASPVQRNSPGDNYQEDDRDSYASDSSQESRGNQHRPQRQRQQQRDRVKNKNDRRRGGAHPMQDPDGVCLYFMQGRCHMGDDCVYSHDAQPPRKMELCKFYLMDCCAKRDKCLYMHADFPCKYYHTGLPCIYKDECKFAHGKPLTDALKNILLKHIESAPKEILGDFPRLNREGALKMIQTTQSKLMQQFPDAVESKEKTIPSLFELNIPNPQIHQDNSLMFNHFNNDRSHKISPKVRQSRWQNDNSNQNVNIMNAPNSNMNAPNVLSIKNLTGVLTSRQISDLTKMGIENLDQLGQLTVLQLNSIGLSLKQITEIQLNTMNIQKLGLINTHETQSQPLLTSATGTKDLDLRVPPTAPASSNPVVVSDLPEKDVDMRFQPPIIVSASEDNTSLNNFHKDTQQSKDMIDIDQYTKDALKFATKDKENIDISNESFEHEKITNEPKDVDHRVLPFSDEAVKVSNAAPIGNHQRKECDTDIRFLQPEPIFKNPEKRNRRSTTDDDDENNLLIDDKWYSSDEEKGNKKKSPMSSPRQKIMSPQGPAPHVIEPSSVLRRLGDLSKIDISEEVTKLLNTMKNHAAENKIDGTDKTLEETNDNLRPRDPRGKRSPDKVTDVIKSEPKKRPKISIYDCVDGEPTDGRRRTDVDLRKSDFMPFGDTDLRQSSGGDIDFRLGLPFKPIPNYTPASEIDGSINSHPPIPYKLVHIHIPRPDYTDIRNSTAKSQALQDPRLRKVFRLSVEESTSDSEKSLKPPASPVAPRVDPRKKPKDVESKAQDQKSSTALDIQTVLQNSNWYKDLSSTQKIFVNQHLAPVTQMIKQFQQDKVPGNKFDLVSVQSNNILCSIFTNLGIALGENGDFSYLPKPKEALLKTPVGFNQNPNPFSNLPGGPGSVDGSNMNMLNMPHMGMGNMNNMNLGNMHNFNQPLMDPRSGPTPGLLGIAPNIPHNFNNANFGAPNNFGSMPFNGPGPGNDFHFMDGGEQNFPRFPNRGGHRGRGNDRWNRGGSGRGNRDRKNFNDRSNWNN